MPNTIATDTEYKTTPPRDAMAVTVTVIVNRVLGKYSKWVKYHFAMIMDF